MPANPCPRCNGLGQRIIKSFDMNAMKDLETRVPCAACSGTGEEQRPGVAAKPLWIGVSVLSLALVAGLGIYAWPAAGGRERRR